METLEDLIRSECERAGAITFARFMELALYHPTLGYYSGGGTGREPLGWSGDFFTSGDVHPLWGWAIARQLHQMWELLEKPARFDVVEPGAARGLLARDVWRYAITGAPEWAAALRYTLVDRAEPASPLWQARQQRLSTEMQTLDQAALPTDALRVVRDLDEQAFAQPFTGCIISNELVDAMPVHILQKASGMLTEVWVTLDPDNGRLVETTGEPSSPELANYLDHYAISWRDYPDGWRCEVCLELAPWLRKMSTYLAQGYLLTIDYGALASELYTPNRRGTLAVYTHHQMRDRPLAQPGQQDITAHVNFTALIEAGQAAGLNPIGLTTQEAFLRQLGIKEEAEAQANQRYSYAETERHTDRGQADYLRRRSFLGAVATLLNPHGLGGFRVLAQQRNVPASVQHLLGFADSRS